MSDHQQLSDRNGEMIDVDEDDIESRRKQGSSDSTKATWPDAVPQREKPSFSAGNLLPRFFRKKQGPRSNRSDRNVDPAVLEEDVSTISSEYLSPRESMPICVLRFAVLFVWLAAACCVSYGVYWYTKRSAFHEFEIQYQADAEKIVESFHATLDKRLGAINTLATALTMYAKCSNHTFPFVTMPDFVVSGSNTRILADAAIVHWLPLVTEETREEWEEYAYANRHQVDEELAKDQAFRRQEDIKWGYTSPENRELEELETTESVSNTTDNSTIIVVNNVVQDGTKFHYRIWSPETKEVIPTGSGPYLPIWQRSPVSQSGQGIINVDMGSARGLSGTFPYWVENKPRGALLLQAFVPHPNVAPLHDKMLADSQYRHQAASYQGTPTTKLAYPVFDGFGEDAEFVGVLATTVYWRLSFTDILLHHAQGMICVIENSFGQVFSYRLDGPNVTYLGEGDPSLEDSDNFIYENMMVTHSPQHPRPLEEQRSFTTMPLDTEFGEYKLKIYPTQDTYEVYKKNEPMVYTVIVASIFGLAAITFLMYDFSVQRLQKTLLAKGLEQARYSAVAERELNEYLSHEVRNPLAAAISACSFVSSAVNEVQPLSDEKSRQTVRDDVHIIRSSLKFINDLLRNMLDLHRAVHHQVAIQKKDTDLYHDVLEPVTSMLYCRNDNFELLLDCPKNLTVETDNLRLKQIILNLGRNAAKFVEKGFVRLRVEAVSNDGETQPSTVRIYVEDSGPGIPVGKRKALFAKFQQSLDLLSQGTGVGLCLSRQLVDILGGDLWLDESYDSGIEGRPGSRFVIDLKTSPVIRREDESTRYLALHLSKEAKREYENEEHASEQPTGSDRDTRSLSTENHQISESTCEDPAFVTQGSDYSKGFAVSLSCEDRVKLNGKAGLNLEDQPCLPKELSVLFVDDDRILRKLFSRSIKRNFPGWRVQEASNGETAIRLVESEAFDLIFMDQYMASTEKQLLGTEATRELRAKGVKSKICGLSANDTEKAFMSAGADGFMLKPMPCDKDELDNSLRSLLNG
jgi:signal transduction histidine kinase/CheY-like chemotaxis protein